MRHKKDKAEVTLILTYTEPYQTLSSDKRLRWIAAQNSDTYLFSQFEKQVEN